MLLLVLVIVTAAVIAAAAIAVTVVTAAVIAAAAVAASRYHPMRLVDWARKGNCELQKQVEVDKDKEELLDSFLPLL